MRDDIFESNIDPMLTPTGLDKSLSSSQKRELMLSPISSSSSNTCNTRVDNDDNVFDLTKKCLGGKRK